MILHAQPPFARATPKAEVEGSNPFGSAMISAALRAMRAASRCANGNRTRREQTRPRDTGATRRFS